MRYLCKLLKSITVELIRANKKNEYILYRQMECAPFSRPLATQGYSSDGDSEEEWENKNKN